MPASYLRAATVALVAVAAACGGGVRPRSSPSTSVARRVPTSAPATPTSTTRPVDFTGAVALATSEIGSAGGDECRLVELGGLLSTFPAPTTRAEAEQAIGVISLYLRELARSVHDDIPKVADQLDNAAEDIGIQAKAVGFDPATLNSAMSVDALNSEALLVAMSDVNQHASARCA